MATVYQHVTDAIIKSLESGVVPWVRPWSEDSKAVSPWGLPMNIATGREYRGANIPLLWGTRQRAGFDNDHWLTLKQANALGGKVLKGERASWVHFYHWREDDKGKRFPLLRAYRVFNVAQTEGCELPTRTGFQQLGAGDLENRVRALGARVRLGGNRAYFDVQGDRIALLLPAQFKTLDNFHSTLAHEVVHWTGHKSRLDRPLDNHFGTAGYAREELIAELGSAFVCARFGIPLEGLQHTEYLASWIKVLKEDSRAIMRAASAAQRAADMIVGTVQPEEGDAKEEEASEPAPMVVVSEPVPVDADTQALAAQYIGEIAKALYWAGHADELDRQAAAKVAAITGKANRRAAGILCDLARYLYLAGLSEANKAKPKARRGKPGNWQRHPVTGHWMNVPQGRDVLDLIPYGRDPKALARVRKHFQTHGRIGAANVLAYCEEAGLDASSYRLGLQSRKREAGPLRYSYGPQRIDPAVVLDIDHGRSTRSSEGQVHATM